MSKIIFELFSYPFSSGALLIYGFSPNCPLTLVKGDYSNGFVRQSVDTILSPQLLLQFSKDFDETFQLLFPWPEDDHILLRSYSTDFYQSYGPLTIFQQ